MLPRKSSKELYLSCFAHWVRYVACCGVKHEVFFCFDLLNRGMFTMLHRYIGFPNVVGTFGAILCLCVFWPILYSNAELRLVELR